MAVSLELLTDEDIIDYTRSNGVDRVLNNPGDINLRFETKIGAIPGGVYDAEIFGSPFEDRCICGFIRKQTNEPCPNCGARVLSREEGLRRFGRIEFPFYYLNELRFEIFYDFFYEIFKDVKINLEFFGDDLKINGYCGKSSKKLGIKAFDTCQFDYSDKKKELTISEYITDESKCSYEGILKIVEQYFPNHLLNLRKLLNRYYIVLPVKMRPFSINKRNGKSQLVLDKLTMWYSMVLKFCCDKLAEESPQSYNNVMSRFKTPGERVRYTALLRAFINSGRKMTTKLLNTSKKNQAREIYSVRVKNSARAPIVPDTELKADEIGIPTHLAYEMCREGFIKYLQEKLNFTWRQGQKATKEEWNNPETMKLFKEYAEQQIVLVY